MCEMKKIYKFCIGALLGTITVSCVDQLDSDKNFKRPYDAGRCIY